MIGKDLRVRSIILTLVLVLIIVTIINLSDERTTVETGPLDKQAPSAAELVRQHFDWAVQQLRSGQYEVAINGFHAVLEQAPIMPEAYVNMDFAHIELKQFEQALKAFQTAIDLRPDQVNAYWGLAVSLEGLCDIPGAMGAMRTYVHLAEPDDPYLRKANAALWEWEQLKKENEEGGPAVTECEQPEQSTEQQ